ncbi:MAG: hypothetical protein AAF499_13565 [Pseudomonadota bacterium]
MAWLTGANVPAAAIGTLVGNPWTFPSCVTHAVNSRLTIIGTTKMNSAGTNRYQHSKVTPTSVSAE